MKGIFIFWAMFLFYLPALAQEEQGSTTVAIIKSKESNRIYGKIVDALTKKPVSAASLQLSVSKKDSLLKTSDSIIRAKLTETNGDFEFIELPSADSFRLVISSVGYKLEEVVISFGTGEKDLGNILIHQEAKQLEGVTITTQKPAMEMGIDRRIFSVDASITATGGTAIDVVKNIPSVSVDAEGNVTLRKSTPQ